MKRVVPFCAILFGTGLVIAWVSRCVLSTPNPEASPVARPTKASSRPPPLRPAEAGAPDVLPLLENATWVPAGESEKMMGDRYIERLDHRTAVLAEELALEDGQREALAVWVDDVASKLASEKRMERVMAIGNRFDARALEAFLATLLAEDRIAALADLKGREHREKVDGILSRNLSRIGDVAELKDGQRERLREILAGHAEALVTAREHHPRPPDLSFNGPDPDPHDLGLEDLIPTGEDGFWVDRAPGDELREAIRARIGERLALVEPALEGEQLEKYRRELETNGLGGLYRMFLPGPAAPPR